MKLQFNESGIAAAFAELQEQNKELGERCAVFALRCARQAEEIAGYKARVEELTAGPANAPCVSLPDASPS